ncbi:adenylate/guanylate cyclase domain-containing protein [Candidatus Woesearchaeota archaeon]|nr:adenylate/guanylate cyclase domain-containing protein [Candidatus Woesearchaeota archaeon]
MIWPFGNDVSRTLTHARIAKLLKTYPDTELVRKLEHYLLNAPLKELRSINLIKLELIWNVNRQQLVPLFLHATQKNLVTLHYVIHCETCKGSSTLEKLTDIQHQMQCAGCKASLNPALDQSVEVAFRVHPDLAGTPKKKPHDRFIPAIEVINTETFRILFEEEKPLPGEHVAIKDLTFLFTDLSGSTATYERLGDGGAYRIVKEHFIILFNLIKKNNGTVVKTIGDAVMATFLNSSDALKTALEARKEFTVFNKRKDVRGAAVLKIGIHNGNCLAVTLNSRLDFFGGTVNKAARIQGIAEANEICISEDALTSAKERALFNGIRHYRKTVQLKGIKNEVPIILLK